MAVVLEIQDGNPWWLSPDIWVVPGTDPGGAPGQPTASQEAHLWARVRNNGDQGTGNIRVRFYAANPAVGFDRSTATLVGTAFVTLAAGQVQDVLCPTPWFPAYVNNGHGCVLAEAFHTVLDPLPGSQAFDVPNDRHVAQRNLTILAAGGGMKKKLAFEIHNRDRENLVFVIATTAGRPAELKRILETTGLDPDVLGRDGEVVATGFVRSPCPDEREMADAEQEVKLELDAGARAGLTWVGELEGDAALVHVVQTLDGKEVGGLSVLLVRDAKER
jgi:hypothetical protein